MSYQRVTGAMTPGAHPGSHNGQDAYNDLLVVSDHATGGMCRQRTDVQHNNGSDQQRAGLYARSASSITNGGGR